MQSRANKRSPPDEVLGSSLGPNTLNQIINLFGTFSPKIPLYFDQENLKTLNYNSFIIF